MSNPISKIYNWVPNTWMLKPILRKNTAKLMVWLMSPHQSTSIRVYAIRSLMEEPITREILTSVLEVHPQVLKK